MTKQITKHKNFFRLQIFSNNVQSGGSWFNGNYFVDLQQFLPSGNSYQIAVESFNLNQTNSSVGYVVHLTNLIQPDTFSTLTNSLSYNILAYNGPNFYRFIDFSSIGCKLQDTSFLSSQFININFTDFLGNQCTTNFFGAGTGASLAWVMSLVIFEIPASEENQ